MTSTEDLLRNALDDLAPGAPADERAFAGIGRAITRRRRRRAQVRMAAVAAVAVAALGTAALVGGRPDETGTVGQPDDPSGEQDNGPDAGTEPEDQNGGVDGVVPTAIGPDASIVLPEGWDVSEQPGGWTDVDAPDTEHPFTSYCLIRPEEAVTGECALEIFHGDVPGSGGFEAYDPDGDWSWYTAGDPPTCPEGSVPEDYGDPVNGDMSPAATATRAIGGRTALYSEWDVVCRVSRFEFTPRGWYLPDENILVIDKVGQPETEAILDSFSFDDEAG